MPDDSKKADRSSAADAIDYAILPDLIGYNLRRAEAAMMQDFVRALGELGITPGQFGTLVLIDANSGLNQTALGNALGIDRSTVVSVIDRLEARGSSCWPRRCPWCASTRIASPPTWMSGSARNSGGCCVGSNSLRRACGRSFRPGPAARRPDWRT